MSEFSFLTTTHARWWDLWEFKGSEDVMLEFTYVDVVFEWLIKPSCYKISSFLDLRTHGNCLWHAVFGMTLAGYLLGPVGHTPEWTTGRSLKVP